MCAKTKNETVSPKCDKSETIELGIRNAWHFVPEIIVTCSASRHVVASKKLGRCYHEYSCELCRYKYTVDSSD